MPFARLDETIEANTRSEERRLRSEFRVAAYTAYLLRPNPEEKTFGQFLDALGMRTDEEETRTLEEELAESREVCAIADKLAAEGKYRKLRGADALRFIGQVKER
jgi:hypothetical protein